MSIRNGAHTGFRGPDGPVALATHRPASRVGHRARRVRTRRRHGRGACRAQRAAREFRRWRDACDRVDSGRRATARGGARTGRRLRVSGARGRADAGELPSCPLLELHPRHPWGDGRRHVRGSPGDERIRAIATWCSTPDALPRSRPPTARPPRSAESLPTASAVGVREGPLVIHALGLEAPGRPLENPRQVPAYSYSRRYGPLPPCFARATLVQVPREERPWLLVGGTASILGEDSIHVRDPRRQAVETFENLARLVESARASAAESRPRRSAVGVPRAARLHRARRGRGSAARDGAGTFPRQHARGIRAGRSVPAGTAGGNRRARHALSDGPIA